MRVDAAVHVWVRATHEPAFAAFTDRTGHRICERYGMSETGITTSNPYDGDRIAGTVGYALPGVEARIVDTNGADVAAGEVGVVAIRSRQVMREYWRRPDATAGRTPTTAGLSPATSPPWPPMAGSPCRVGRAT